MFEQGLEILFFKKIFFRSVRYIAFINRVELSSHSLSNIDATFVALIDLLCDILFVWKERRKTVDKRRLIHI